MKILLCVDPNTLYVKMVCRNYGCSIARFLKSKIEAPETVISMIVDVGNLCRNYTESNDVARRHMTIYLRYDGGTEYVNTELQNWLKKRNIKLKITDSCALESNGRAERLNCLLLDMARNMMIPASDRCLHMM